MTLSTPIFDLAQETITISDSTTYTSPVRNTLAVYFQVYKMDKDSNETELAVTTNAVPATASQWVFSMALDGWYKVRTITLPQYNPATAYAANNIVYYNGLLYKVLQSSTGNLPTNPTYFEVITIDGAAVVGNNLTIEYFDYVFVEYGKICAGDAVGAWANSSSCGGCSKTDLMASWLKKDAMVYAIERFYAISQFSKAEEIARELENACESC